MHTTGAARGDAALLDERIAGHAQEESSRGGVVFAEPQTAAHRVGGGRQRRPVARRPPSRAEDG